MFLFGLQLKIPLGVPAHLTGTPFSETCILVYNCAHYLLSQRRRTGPNLAKAIISLTNVELQLRKKDKSVLASFTSEGKT